MITFTVPAKLRSLFWHKQRTCYDLLLKTAWQTVDCFARRDPRFKGKTGPMLCFMPTIVGLVATHMCTSLSQLEL